ncbi:MAG: hypothetical protein QM808_06900 [Steroidobacteraceae bacterium]
MLTNEILSSEIAAASLTTFDVSADGSCARLHMLDSAGQPATLILPVNCLHQLLMSIPKMVQMALQRSHVDDSMRLVHALEGFKLEAGELGESGESQFILTMHTTGDFAVSFSASTENMAALANSILEETPQYSLHASGARLSS